MKKLIILLSGILLLTACTGEEVKPPTNELESEAENDQENIEEESEENARLDSPPIFRVEVDNERLFSPRDTLCWEPEERPCDLEINDPRELTSELPNTLVNANEQISYGIVTSGEDFDKLGGLVPDPDQVVVMRYQRGELQEEFEMENEAFSAPEESGLHYYLFHLIWDDDYYGESIHGFKLTVRE
ncbi:hypothetical protein [Alkalibacillus haloalkaliphilus]|uniref:hypothetical protein n=1 Tax=Alkalibacillus haloalkaliphilus TaxID=94136 RepID=UPI002935F8BA|nr:hypothetical protein [Alkalibacillus haloalkaliphilus]MDV2583452.1 hypothetical protein [Alkalibacillus haloalkaliphilus]